MKHENFIVQVKTEEEFLSVLKSMEHSLPILTYSSHKDSYKQFVPPTGVYYIGVHNNSGWYNGSCSYPFITFEEFLQKEKSECIIFN